MAKSKKPIEQHENRDKQRVNNPPVGRVTPQGDKESVKKKYQLPDFLLEKVEQEEYEKWLQRKARGHFRRDRGRGNNTATAEEYKMAIHEAVLSSHGVDVYTGEELNWTLLNTYNNKQSKKRGKEYKRQFDLLPSVDHVDDGKGAANFKICAWRTNDAKNDLSYEEFVELCKKVIEAANKSL
jgi:hypothetical protein